MVRFLRSTNQIIQFEQNFFIEKPRETIECIGKKEYDEDTTFKKKWPVI